MREVFLSRTKLTERAVDVIDVTNSARQLGFPFFTFLERDILRDLAIVLNGDEDGDLALELLVEWALGALAGKKSAVIVSQGQSMTVRFRIRFQRRGESESKTFKLAMWFGHWEQATVIITMES